MIRISDDYVVVFNGTPLEITAQFSVLLKTFKDMLIYDYSYTEEDAFEIVKNIGGVAFMSDEEKAKLLDDMNKEN